jgi:outer membrane protein OmpA-like peptidoglycan-associated protein
MDVNLLEVVKRTMSGDVINRAATLLGESEGATRGALDKLLPALIGGIAAKGATLDGARDLLSLARDVDVPAIDSLIAGAGDVQQRASGLLATGTRLVTSMFGDRAGALASSLASITGLKGSSATSLIALATPVLFGAVKKLIGNRGLDAGGLMALLGGQGRYLQGVDGALTRALGFANPQAMLGSIGGQVSEAVRDTVTTSSRVAADASRDVYSAATRRKSGLMRAVPWVIAALALFALLQYFGGPRDAAPPTTAAVAPPAEPAVPPAQEIAPPQKVIAKVYFDTGSPAIGQQTKDTISQVAQTIKRDSKKVAVTGYADHTGDAAANAELAKERAKAVKEALVAEGVSEEAVALLPPISTTGSGTDEEARRVDIAEE